MVSVNLPRQRQSGSWLVSQALENPWVLPNSLDPLNTCGQQYSDLLRPRFLFQLPTHNLASYYNDTLRKCLFICHQ